MLSATVAAAILDHYFRNIDLGSPPATIYIALHTDNPAYTGSEVTGGSYARQVITFTRSGTVLTGPASDITFPAPTADWGYLRWFGIWNASSAGTNIDGGLMVPPIEVLSGSSAPVIRAGSITITIPTV